MQTLNEHAGRYFIANISTSFLDKVVAPLERRAKSKGCAAALRSLSAARTCCPGNRWDADAVLRRNQHVADARRALAGLPVRASAPAKPLPISGGLGVRHIQLYGHLGDDREDGIDGEAVAKAIRKFPASCEVKVHINSGGGVALDAGAMYDALRAHPGKVTTYNDGLALSGGSIVLMAGQTRCMARNAVLMVHDSSPALPDAKLAQFAEKMSERNARLYASRSRLSVTEVRAMMRRETWLDAAESLKLGLVDEVTPTTHVGAAADLDGYLSAYKNVPQFVGDTKAKLDRFYSLVQLSRGALKYATAVSWRRDAVRLADELRNCWGVDPADLLAALDTISDEYFDGQAALGLGPQL